MLLPWTVASPQLNWPLGASMSTPSRSVAVRGVKALAVLALAVFPNSPGFGASLPRSSPEAQGVSSSAVLAFLDAADRMDSMDSFMLLRHGQVIAEGWWAPYDADSPHSLYSLSKSFTATAAGMAIAEGKLTLDDEVLKFF